MKETLDKTHPHLSSEWADDRPMSEFTWGSGRKVLRRCIECDYAWLIRVQNWARYNTKCVSCSGAIVTETNNLAVTNPELAEEWKDERPMTQFTYGSGAVVLRKCKDCGYEFRRKIYLWVKGYGCPVCSGRIASETNNLQIDHPEFAEEWADSRPMASFRSSSSKKVLRQCKHCGYKWEIALYNWSRGRGCSNCSEYKTSKVEKLFSVALTGRENSHFRGLKNPLYDYWDFDYRLYDKVIGEYFGSRFHSDEEARARDTRKITQALNEGYSVFIIRDDNTEPLSIQHDKLLQIEFKHQMDSKHEERIESVSRKLLSWVDTQK